VRAERPWLTVEQRQKVRRLRREGLRLWQIAETVGCGRATVCRVLRGPGRIESGRVVWAPGAGRLSLVEREEISRGLRAKESMRSIARRLERAPSTITREVNANGGPSHYRATWAHHGAYAQSRRPKRAKLAAGRLCDEVTAWLEQWWSPEEISRRLRIEFPDDPEMRVSHETIYQSLFVQGRGELRRELARCLRSGRAQRRPRSRVKPTGGISDMVMISERPAEVEDRAVPGHWEGDLVRHEALF
jgi:IS30 family transposase